MQHCLRMVAVLLTLLASLVSGVLAQPNEIVIDPKPLPSDPDWPDSASPRAPQIARVVIVPEEDGWLPSHPLTPSFVLFVYGYHLSDASNPVRIEATGAGNIRYTTLAEGDWGTEAIVDINVAKRAAEMHPRLMWRELERIRRAWAKGWETAKPPAGPHPPDRLPYGVLIRADVTAPNSPASQRFSLRGAAQTWTRPELPRRPEEFCPSLLLKSVHEDFVYRRWVGWDDIWGGVRPGTPPSMISDSLLHSRETPATRLERQLYDMPQAIGETTPSRSVADACLKVSGLTDAQNRDVMLAMVGEYYWSKRRLRDGILVTMQNLVPLNKLKIMQCPRRDVPAFGASSLSRRPNNTPDTPIDHVACGEYHRARGVSAICQRLKQECRGDENFGDMIEQADAVYRQWTAIDIARQRRESIVRNSLTFPSDRAKALREIDQLREAQKALESINPWVAQGAFRQALAEPYTNCANNKTPVCDLTRPILACEAIRKQAYALEQRLLGHLDKFRTALDCIEGGPCQLNTDELRKIVHSAPPVLASPEPAAGEEYHRTTYANAQFDWANSRRVQRGYADNIDGALHDFYVGVALTGLTMGMGEVALALRGISAGATTTTAARASLTGARLLEAGAVLVDLGASAKEIRNAVAECTDAFADTTPLERVPFDTIRGPTCTGADYAGPRIVKDSQSCITRAVLMEIATGILPMVPGAVRDAMDFTTLRRASKALDNRPLTPAQANALTTLFSRRLTKMGPDEVADAVHQLRIAGFKDHEILDVLSALAPDLKKVGTRLVSGLRGTPGVNTTVMIDGVEHLAVISTIMGRTRLVLCSSCGGFEQLIGDLLKDARLSPQGRKKLTELRGQIRDLELRDLTPEQLNGQMGMILRGLDEIPADKALIRDALQARKAAAIDPMVPAHNRPGGGRDFIAGFRNNPAPGIPDNLQPIEALIENGRLTRETYAKAATILDESLYLARLSGDNPASRLVRSSDLNRLENMANDLGAALGLDRQLNKDVIDALVARYRSAKAAGNQTMSGELITSMAHADVDIPRTTPELRLMVNNREFPDPLGTPRVPKLGERIEADHIFPVASIKRRIPEYAQLDWAKRAEVLHNKENIAGLPRELNRLKGDHDVNGFEAAFKKEYGPDARLSKNYKDWLETKQVCMEALLRAQVRCLLPLQPPADYKICNPPKDYKPHSACR